MWLLQILGSEPFDGSPIPPGSSSLSQSLSFFLKELSFLVFVIFSASKNHLYKTYVFPSERHTYREKDREKDLPLLAHFPHGCNGWSGAILKPGASSRSSMWMQGPKTWDILCCFPKPLADSWVQSGTDRAGTDITGRGLAYCTTMPAPHSAFLSPRISLVRL